MTASTGATTASRCARSTGRASAITPRRRPRPAARPTSTSWTCSGASDAELLADHGRWYIAERDPRYLRRNALVALGNVGDAGDPETAATLSRYARGDDELLAEHARWAQVRLGHIDDADATADG